MNDWTEKQYLGAIAITVLAWLGFTLPWAAWSQSDILKYAASLCLLVIGCLLPLRWQQGVARVPIFILMLTRSAIAVPVGYLVGRFAPSKPPLVAALASSALPFLAMLLVCTPLAQVSPVPDWPRWRVATTIGFMTVLTFWSGAYVAMLTMKSRDAQQDKD